MRARARARGRVRVTHLVPRGERLLRRKGDARRERRGRALHERVARRRVPGGDLVGVRVRIWDLG